VNRVILNESGRSQRAIIDLANYLVDWTTQEHPNEEVRNAFDGLHIIPTQAGDPQPNPPYNPASVQLIEQDLSPTAELKAVADSLQRWVPQHPEQTVAVLVPRNERGFELIELLRKQEIPFVELLRSTTATRHTAGSIGNVLRCLADPTSARRLADAFRVWRRDDRADPELHQQVQAVAKRIASCPAVEAYLWPRADHDWLPLAALGRLPSLDEPALDESAAEMALLCGFRDIARRWQRAAMSVSIDQLILTIAADLFSEQADLALAFKLASLLRDVAAAHPSYRLVELAEELATIAHNERKFIGFSSDDLTFEPPKGRVTVTTIHKAKGLEWDRVYLTSVNNYDFPSGRPGDTYIAEKWFVRDRLNLEAEALAQLKVLAQQSATESYREGEATQKARRDYVGERLRLLYVGITRAKKELIITWNTGRARPEGPRQPAEPLIALQEYHRRTRDMLPDPARPKELAADG
jgi:DNA helicase-2/ATP-dependent DNA helicase PcrA